MPAVGRLWPSVHDGDKEHEWDVKSRAFESRIESDKTSWVHLFTLPLENATGRSLTGYCDGDDKTDGMTIPNVDFVFGNFYFFDNLGYRF